MHTTLAPDRTKPTLMATAILIVFNTPEHGHSNGVFEKHQFLHSQKLRTVVGQKYRPEWYFLTRPARMIKKKCSYKPIGALPPRIFNVSYRGL